VNAFMKWRMKQFLLFDAALVTISYGLAVLLVHIFIPTHQLVHLLDGIRTAVYSTASAGCAALLGFIITMTTITGAVMQNSQWDRFRKSFAYSQVQDIYFNTIRWLGFGSLLYLVFLIADTDKHPQLLCEAFGALVACIIVVRMWRSIAALEKLLRMNSFKLQSGQ
jgi:hypothetical protein